MADTPKRLAGPVAVSVAAATVYTTPALTTTIVRNIRVANTTAADIAFSLSIGVDAAATRLFDQIPVPARGVLDLGTFLVLATAELLQAKAAALGLTLTISGVETT